MRHLAIPNPVAVLSVPEWVRRPVHRATAQVAALWDRWRRWEYRYEALFFVIIVLLLLIYAWVLFTGSIARRH